MRSWSSLLRNGLSRILDAGGRMRSMLDYVLDAAGRARSALTTLFDSGIFRLGSLISIEDVGELLFEVGACDVGSHHSVFCHRYMSGLFAYHNT